jgi:hypothetical protein
MACRHEWALPVRSGQPERLHPMWLELKSGSCDAWAMDQEGVYNELLGGYIVPSNPWFDAAVDSPHGPIEFIRFQAGLEAIARYLDLLEEAVGRSLAEERAAFERRDFLARAPSGWEGEAELVASEVLAENEDFLPPFAYGSTLALCFTVFERLLRDLVTLTEDQTSHSLKAFARRRGEPYIAHAQRFLEATFGTDIGVDDETAAELDRLRRLRNRFVHELAEPSSGQPVRAEPPGPSPAPIDRRTIEHALRTLGSCAAALGQVWDEKTGNSHGKAPPRA